MQHEEKNMIGAESTGSDSDRTYRNEAGKSEKDGDEEKENQREKKRRKSQKLQQKFLPKTPHRKNGSQKSNKLQKKSSKSEKGGRSGRSARRKSGKSGKNKKGGLQKEDGKKKKGGNSGMRKVGDEDMEKSRMSMSICGGGVRLWLVLLALHSFVVPVFLVVIDSVTWIRAELALYIVMLVLNWAVGVLTFIVLFMKSSDGRKRLAFLLIVGRLCCLILAVVSLIMAFVIVFKPKYAYKYGAWPFSWWAAWVGLLVLSGIDIALQTMGIIVACKIWRYIKKEEENNDE